MRAYPRADYRREAYVMPPVLRKGSRGDGVRWLLECLRLQEPEIWERIPHHGDEEFDLFDLHVHAAVRDFQSQCKLTVDGIVGPQTWNAFFAWSKLNVPTSTKISDHLIVAEVIDWREHRHGNPCWRVLYKPIVALRFEKMRELAGNMPIRINSGDRTPATNKAIGGASASRHMYGHAIDYSIPGLSNAEHYRLGKEAGFNGVANYDPRIYANGYGHGDLGLARVAWRTWGSY